MRKGIIIIWMWLLCCPLMAQKPFTLVLDAGHGGKDPGAVGKFSQEKDLNLTLVLEVGKLINEQYPDVKVIYTRSTDVFIPLQTRADIANKAGADLFLSIHTNSAEKKEPRGVETFILGTDKMEQNLDVAMRENAVIKLEADYKTTYQGFDPNSIDSYIMFELMQNSHMDQSLRFAEQVQQRFVGHLNREDRGVRQAAFWVLHRTACPSVLFEMGFISNPEEERFLNNDSVMTQMAQALVNAFGAYVPKAAKPNDEMSAAEPLNDEPQVVQTYYAIQVCASKTVLAADDPKLKGVPCEYIQMGDWYKYYTAAHTDRAVVAEQLPELKKLFPDCWIIKFDK